MTAVRFARLLAALAVAIVAATGSAAAQWRAPIGIPAPSFGVNEVAPAVPSPWVVGTPGFYYVDATSSKSTDNGNPYGTPGKPRNTIPTVLPAGAVVELHGTYSANHTSPNGLVSRGTASNPVFIRGASTSTRPYVQSGWEINGSYLIVENIEFGPNASGSDTGYAVILAPSTHVALRHSDLHGTKTDGGLGVVNWVGAGAVADNVVIYDNKIHDNGDVNANFDQDVHGIAVSAYVNHLWVVDNEMYRNSGDGIQINATDGLDQTTHHIYVGRNVSHNNKQTGYWVKQATDVIMSQNESYGHRPGNSSMGQCIGGQYAPDWVWFLYNNLHDCEYGVTLMSDLNNPTPVHLFVIGNVIHNIHRTSSTNSPDDAWGPSAVFASGGWERHIVNNTIYDVDSGVNMATPEGSLEVADNIIANVTLAGASHINVEFNALANNTNAHHNLLFGNPRIAFGGSQTKLSTGQLSSMQSISNDPMFVNAPAGDLHIAVSSPAANKGELNAVYSTFQQRYGFGIADDADGNARPNTATQDIGAYLANGASGAPQTPPPTTPTPPAPTCTAASIPNAPTNLALVSQGNGSLVLTWNRPTQCGVPTSYILEAGTAPGLSDMGTRDSNGASTRYQADDLPPGTYWIRVRARNAAGTGDPSNEVKVGGAPGTPENVKASVSGNVITITWDPPTTGGTPSAYIIEAGLAPGRTDVGLGNVNADQHSASGPAAPNKYYIRVRSISIAGTSAPSDDVVAVVR